MDWEKYFETGEFDEYENATIYRIEERHPKELDAIGAVFLITLGMFILTIVGFLLNITHIEKSTITDRSRNKHAYLINDTTSVVKVAETSQKGVNNGILDLIKANATEYGADYRLMYAISKHETGFKSNLFITKNNCGGFNNGSWMSFDSLDSCYDYMARFIIRKFQGKTIEQIQPAYCMSGCENWVRDVKEIYNENVYRIGGETK